MPKQSEVNREFCKRYCAAWNEWPGYCMVGKHDGSGDGNCGWSVEALERTSKEQGKDWRDK